jgi:hypothetical protein
MDYSEVEDKPKENANTSKSQKGTIEIAYLNYVINKGIDDAVFKKPENPQ